MISFGPADPTLKDNFPEEFKEVHAELGAHAKPHQEDTQVGE